MRDAQNSVDKKLTVEEEVNAGELLQCEYDDARERAQAGLVLVQSETILVCALAHLALDLQCDADILELRLHRGMIHGQRREARK